MVTHQHNFHTPIDQYKIPVVFIPGIKGSKIKDAKGKTVWFNFRQGFNVQTPDLELPMDWSDEPNEEGFYVQKHDGSRASSVLGRVGFVKFYDRVFGEKKHYKRPFYEFGYDWRRDINESRQIFEQYLLDISAKHDHSRIQVIAHSLGGLITFGVVNTYPDLFHSVIFAGTPFHEGIGFLLDVHGGVRNGFNSRILSPEVLFTFPSVFNFCMDSDRDYFYEYGTENLDPLKVNLHDPDDWVKFRLSAFKDGVSDQKLNHLMKCLHNSKLYRERYIRNDPNIKYPPISILMSRKHKTIVKVVKNGPKSLNGLDFTTGDMEWGDGRVSFRGALPPDGVQYNLFLTNQPHGTLLEDPILRTLVISLVEKTKIELEDALAKSQKAIKESYIS